MKNRSLITLRIAGAIALLSLAASSLQSLQAIPNTVGGLAPGFVNPAGMRLEDYANRSAMWVTNAELKGEWELWRDESIEDSTIEVMRLKNPATVFGVKATEVTLQMRDMQPILIQVKYSTEEEATPGKTRDQLISNINVWSGGAISADKPKIAAEHTSVEIGSADEDAVAVRFAALGS